MHYTMAMKCTGFRMYRHAMTGSGKTLSEALFLECGAELITLKDL
jgi:hypothetical protein